MLKFTISFKTEDISTEFSITDEGEIVNIIILSRITEKLQCIGHTQHEWEKKSSISADAHYIFVSLY